jgi:hypothetical protein
MFVCCRKNWTDFYFAYLLFSNKLHFPMHYKDLPDFDISNLHPLEYLERGKDDKPDSMLEFAPALEPFSLQPGNVIRTYRCSFANRRDSDEED